MTIDREFRTDVVDVFVYGTLRTGWGNSRHWAGKARAEPATVAGAELWGKGRGFPYATLSNDPTNVVTGDLLTFNTPQDRTAAMVDLDRLEGLGFHYDRVVVTVQKATGQLSEAWMYVPMPDTCRHLGDRIDSGDWNAQ